MKNKTQIIRPKKSQPKTGSLEVIDKFKSGGKINIRVRLVPSVSQSLRLSLSKLTTTTHTSSYDSNEGSKISPLKVSISLDNPKLIKPDDFIEPLANLCIPNTEEYMQHRHLSEPIPEIVDSETSSKNLKNKIKVSMHRPKNHPMSKSLQVNNICSLSKINKNQLKPSPSKIAIPNKKLLIKTNQRSVTSLFKNE